MQKLCHTLMKALLRNILLLSLFGHWPIAHALDADNLDQVHQIVVDEFERVVHLNAETLLALESNNVVVFDVREEEEFNVSRLSGAIQVDPDISSRKFFALYKDSLESKKVIFYCSVGYRSSRLAEQLLDDKPRDFSPDFYNLEGGIFNWHNNRHLLVDQDGKTDAVHAYNSKWSRLVNRKEKIQF